MTRPMRTPERHSTSNQLRRRHRRISLVLFGILALAALVFLWYRSLYDVRANRALESAEADVVDLAGELGLDVIELRSFPPDDAAGWEPSRENNPEAHPGAAIAVFVPLAGDDDLASGVGELVARFRSAGWEQVMQSCPGSDWTLGFSDGTGRGTAYIRDAAPLDEGWQLEIWVLTSLTRDEVDAVDETEFDDCFS